MCLCVFFFFFSSRRRHTRCALVTGVQTCALPISDIGLAVIDPRDAEIARLKAHVAYLMKVSMSKVLPDLLAEDETTALVDFVQHLRAQKEKNDEYNQYRMEPDDMESHSRLHRSEEHRVGKECERK